MRESFLGFQEFISFACLLACSLTYFYLGEKDSLCGLGLPGLDLNDSLVSIFQVLRSQAWVPKPYPRIHHNPFNSYFIFNSYLI